MRVVVIGASGRSGQAAVARGVEAGHDMVAVVRNPARAPAGVAVARSDARDTAALAGALGGADAVVSCLGHVAGEKDAVLLQEAASALVTAMAQTGVGRLVIVSAAGAYVAGDDPLSRFVAKPILERVLKENNRDTRAMEAVVRGSSASWTVLRPSRLIPGPGPADYRVGVDRSVRWRYSTHFDTVGRAAVDALGRPEWIGHAVFITG
jgi:putative NADH-flavin reductase